MKIFPIRTFYKCLLALLTFCTITGPALSQAGGNNYPPRLQPDRINLTVTADPSTSMAVTWRTDSTVKTAYAKILVANANPLSNKDAQTLTARTETNIVEDGKYKDLSWKGVTANYHSVIFETLKPNTTYAYRVGNAGHWSEWLQFKTAGNMWPRLKTTDSNSEPIRRLENYSTLLISLNKKEK